MASKAKSENKLWAIAEKGQLAALLDISTPKPGNVNRYQDHPDTRFIHFATSAAKLGQPLYLAARRGFEYRNNSATSTLELGALIKTAVQRTMEPHKKNTLLGTVLLLIPLAVSAGIQINQDHTTLAKLRNGVSKIIRTSTVDDAVNLIETLQLAQPGGAIPKTSTWKDEQQAVNFQSPQAIQVIQNKGYTLKTLLTLAASYDSIAREYATDFSYIFEELYPQLHKTLSRYPRIEDAVLVTYLWALSKRLDTLIQRKAGPDVAKQVSSRADQIYKRLIESSPTRWLETLRPFDEYLRSRGSTLNPGTTADLTSAAIYLALLTEDIQMIL